jgi:CheY-like chemotaxis protein/anti-sigma regulatory factor (Ser/Thr protein kinase)
VSKILLVEDDRTTQHLLQSLLKRAKHTVTALGDGAKALAQMKRKKFDLVLLDIWLPGMNGLEVLGELHAWPAPPKVIVMTSDDTPETVLKAVREQAFHYMQKPVDPQVLLEVVERALAPGAVVRPIEVISAKPNWVELLVPCDLGTAERIQSFMTSLKADLPENVRTTVGEAFHELLMNAIEWGGKLDPSRQVRIAYVRTSRLLIYRIADPGQGFRFENLTHSAISNPSDDPFQHTMVREEKGLRPGGFGLLLTRKLVDDLVYNEKQNEVLFVKYLEGN